MSKVKKYFNPKQIETMLISAKDLYVIASRGFGKSEGIDAPMLLRNVMAMPRGCGALLSPTYKKLLTNTLPAVCHALSRLGYHRNVHYYVGIKPKKEMHFAIPYVDPFSYEYCMTWFNGTVVHFVSFDRPMSANSLNLDFVMGFEAKFLPWEKIVSEVFPAVRGNEQYFGDCPWHHSLTFTTDMPTSKSGNWILDKEKEMDPELIDVIRHTAIELQYYRSRESEKPFYARKVAELQRDLSEFRRNAVLYAEYDIFDNLELIGEKRIREFKRDLPPLMFNTSILNIKPRKIANGFYSSLNENIHCYDVRTSEYLETLQYDFERTSRPDCRHDADLDPDQPLCIALDYNAAICSMVIGQRVDREARTVNSLFVKTPKKLPELVQDFCDYYLHFPNRNLVYFYDSTAIYETASSSTSYKDDVISVLERNNWEVEAVYMGQQPRHDWKHKEFDSAFKGSPDHLFPTFNPHNNEYLLLAMDQAGVKLGRNGFEKDKSVEKTEDTPDNPDELKTHITDAWDQLYLGMLYHYPDNCPYSIHRKWV